MMMYLWQRENEAEGYSGRRLPWGSSPRERARYGVALSPSLRFALLGALS